MLTFGGFGQKHQHKLFKMQSKSLVYYFTVFYKNKSLKFERTDEKPWQQNKVATNSYSLSKFPIKHGTFS